MAAVLLATATVPCRATAFIVVDATTGKILAGQNAESKLAVASLTKVATAVVTLDWLALSRHEPTEMAVVTAAALQVGGANPVGLRPGDAMSVRDLLYCALMQSDNIAAATLASHVGGALLRSGGGGGSAEEAFVYQMNQLARKLNMRRTNFVNPHGLDNSSRYGRSTAGDMALLAQYAMKNSGFVFYVSQKERTVNFRRGGTVQSYRLRNTNELLGRDAIDGVKTGRTQRAGDCLILSAARSPESVQQGERVTITPRRLIVVLLRSADRFSEGYTLLRRGWQAYDTWVAQGRPLDERSVLR